MSTVISKMPFISYFLDPGFSQGFHITLILIFFSSIQSNPVPLSFFSPYDIEFLKKSIFLL